MSDDPFDATNEPEDFDVDLKNAGGGELNGQYILKLLDVKSAVSKNSGNDMWVWDWAIVADGRGNDQHAGRQLTSYTALTESALWKVEEHGVALGICEPGERMKFKRAEVIGRMVLADVAMVEGRDGPRKFPTVGTLYPHPSGAGFKGAATRPTPKAVPPKAMAPTKPADRSLGGPPVAKPNGAGPRRGPPATAARPKAPEPEPEDPGIDDESEFLGADLDD